MQNTEYNESKTSSGSSRENWDRSNIPPDTSSVVHTHEFVDCFVTYTRQSDGSYVAIPTAKKIPGGTIVVSGGDPDRAGHTSPNSSRWDAAEVSETDMATINISVADSDSVELVIVSIRGDVVDTLRWDSEADFNAWNPPANLAQLSQTAEALFDNSTYDGSLLSIDIGGYYLGAKILGSNARADSFFIRSISGSGHTDGQLFSIGPVGQIDMHRSRVWIPNAGNLMISRTSANSTGSGWNYSETNNWLQFDSRNTSESVSTVLPGDPANQLQPIDGAGVVFRHTPDARDGTPVLPYTLGVAAAHTHNGTGRSFVAVQSHNYGDGTGWWVDHDQPRTAYSEVHTQQTGGVWEGSRTLTVDAGGIVFNITDDRFGISINAGFVDDGAFSGSLATMDWEVWTDPIWIDFATLDGQPAAGTLSPITGGNMLLSGTETTTTFETPDTLDWSKYDGETFYILMRATQDDGQVITTVTAFTPYKAFRKATNIVVDGDSLINGGSQWPTQLGKTVEGFFAVGGRTLATIASELSANVATVTNDFDYLLIGGVINDLGGGNATVAQVTATIQTIVDFANQLRLRVIFVNTPPTTQFPLQILLDCNAAFQAAQDANWHVTVYDQYSVLVDPAVPGQLNPLYDSGDGLHPNAAGEAANVTGFLAFESSKTFRG